MPLSRDALVSLAVDGYFGNVAARRLDAILANFAPDAVMAVPTMAIAYRGLNAIRTHFEDFFASYKAGRFQDFTATADPVTQSIAVRFTVILSDASGAELRMTNCNFFDLDDSGRFARVTIYTTATPTAGFTAGASA